MASQTLRIQKVLEAYLRTCVLIMASPLLGISLLAIATAWLVRRRPVRAVRVVLSTDVVWIFKKAPVRVLRLRSWRHKLLTLALSTESVRKLELP